MSNKADQSSSKAKAGVAATRALAGILSPEAAIAAGSLSTPAAVEATNAPTSVMGNLMRSSYANMQKEENSQVQTVIKQLRTNKAFEDNPELFDSLLSAIDGDFTKLAQELPSTLEKKMVEKLSTELAPVFQDDVKTAVLNPHVEKSAKQRTDLVRIRKDFSAKASVYLEACQMKKKCGLKLGEDLQMKGMSLTDLKQRNEQFSSASNYEKFALQDMYEVLSNVPIAQDVSKLEMPSLPASIDSSKRKEVLNMLMNWSRQPAVIKNFPMLILDVRSMASIMDPITGIYDAPIPPKDKDLLSEYNKQDKALALELQAEVKNIEYTSLWKMSASIGAGEYRKLWTVEETSGLSMLYAWVSQYVCIETGTSRTDVLVTLQDLHPLFAGPGPIADNEVRIKQILETSHNAGVAPDWISVGVKCVREVVKRGQAYSDECTANSLRKDSPWSKEPMCHDVTRMLIDLIGITKNVDNEEELLEAPEEKSKKVSTLNVDTKKGAALPNKVKNMLKKSKGMKIDDIPLKNKRKIEAFLVERDSSTNVENTRHVPKMIAGSILLDNGIELSTDSLSKASKELSGTASKKRKTTEGNGEKQCDGHACKTMIPNDHKSFCDYHFKILKEKGYVWKKNGERHEFKSGKGGKGGKGKKGGKGGKGDYKKKNRITVYTKDSDSKVKAYNLDAETCNMINAIKTSDSENLMTEEQVKEFKSTSSSIVASICQ